MRKFFALLIAFGFVFGVYSIDVYAADGKGDLSKANQLVENAIEAGKAGDLSKAKELYDEYNSKWISIEDGVKEQSKEAYGDIEGKMGMVEFLFSQSPVQKDKVVEVLLDLDKTNEKFISNEYKAEEKQNKGKTITVKDLVQLLDIAKSQIQQGDIDSAVKTMNNFSSSWLEVEGTVLTQSKKVYDDAEKDMVSVKAYLTVEPVQKDKALKVIDRMHSYLSLVAGDTSYSMVDVITIILREGLEALLVVIALLGFIKKSGQGDKKGWIYGGVIVGFAVSIILAFLVKLLFSSGTFGNNNFLISGWTGVFAAVMLIYVSYWLHSKSNVTAWKGYIENKGTKSLATGSLISLAFLAFLAVFREGTETVLFYIGMASSIRLMDLFLGIALGLIILAVIAVLILKVGLRIPMRPFFFVSSLLVFYLGLKFTGMGINGLQLAGVIPATTKEYLPTIGALGVYPTWEGIVPQLILVIMALAIAIWKKFKRI